MITFETQKDFESAIFNYLANNLTVTVNMVYDGDYYNPKKVPEIIISLNDQCIAEDRAY